MKAVSSLGISDQVLAAVESAAADFERLVTDHAGDRSTFDSMISTMCRGDDADQSNLQQRRAAFRANRHVWGVQAGMQVKCVFTNYGEDPARVSVAVVDGYVALRQLRHGAPLIITSARAADDLGAPLKVRRRPIDTDAPSMHGLALLREFCSQPQPELKEVAAASGFVCGELTSQGLGIGGAITCFTGWQADNVASRYRAPGNLLAITHGAVRIPCESITICLLTRIGLFEGAQPQLAVYSDHMAELPYPVHLQRLDHLLLPDESVAYLGRGATALSTLEAPRMAELAQYVFDRVGWNGEEFEVHRCQIAYPILPSTVAISIDLPERRG